MPEYLSRKWYTPLIILLAAIDNLIVIVPTEGFLISSSMLAPKRWFSFALVTAIGSTLGALVLAYLIEDIGLPQLLEFYPDIVKAQAWKFVEQFFHKYGLLCVFLVAVTPLMQQPAVIIASLAHTPYYKLGFVIFAGRFIKYIIYAYISSHSPKLISKMWGLKDELQQTNKSN